MSQTTQPVTPQAEPPKKKRKGLYFLLIVAVFVVIGIAASSNGDKDSSEPPAFSKGTGSHQSAAKPEPKAVDAFKAYVEKNGTAVEKAAAKHVTKVQGADGNNDILDAADIYTDYAGDMVSDDAGRGKLLAAAFADWQQSRGKESKNGLVTVYNNTGDILSNGKY
jgi:hypothetical protein